MSNLSEAFKQLKTGKVIKEGLEESPKLRNLDKESKTIVEEKKA